MAQKSLATGKVNGRMNRAGLTSPPDAVMMSMVVTWPGEHGLDGARDECTSPLYHEFMSLCRDQCHIIARASHPFVPASGFAAIPSSLRGRRLSSYRLCTSNSRHLKKKDGERGREGDEGSLDRICRAFSEQAIQIPGCSTVPQAHG